MKKVLIVGEPLKLNIIAIGRPHVELEWHREDGEFLEKITRETFEIDSVTMENAGM